MRRERGAPSARRGARPPWGSASPVMLRICRPDRSASGSAASGIGARNWNARRIRPGGSSAIAAAKLAPFEQPSTVMSAAAWPKARTASGKNAWNAAAPARAFGPVEAVRDGQIPPGDPLLARQGEVRQHDAQVAGARRPLSQVVGVVRRHARPVGRVFDQEAGGLANMEREEVPAVVHRGQPVAARQRQPHPAQRLGVGATEGHVVDDAGAGQARDEAGRVADIHRVGQRRRGGSIGAHQPDDDAVGILQAQHPLAEFPRRSLDRHSGRERPRRPGADRVARRRQADLATRPCPTRPGAPASHTRGVASEPGPAPRSPQIRCSCSPSS